MSAWEITEEDVANVFRGHGLSPRAAELSRAHDEVLDDADRIIEGALRYTDMDNQTASMLQDIEQVLIREGFIPPGTPRFNGALATMLVGSSDAGEIEEDDRARRANGRHIKNEHGTLYLVDSDNFLIDGVDVNVELSEIIDRDLEQFLDLISEEAGFALLMQQSYTIVAHHDTTVTLRVKGDVSGCIDEDDEIESIEDATVREATDVR